LHWCPTGTFATVPLHAAGIYDDSAEQAQCCSDYIVSSYTPTLTSLLRAQNSNTAGAKSSISVALVAEKRAQDRNLPTINGVDAEINSITEVAKSMNVKDIQYQKGSTTVSCTSAAIKAADIVHLACHGIQDHANTTNSGFCLGDGRLTISDLMKLEIKPGLLAFLSACESAQGNKQQPDQAMHLAAAMLFSGFNNVIGSMW
jgi:CHAT domain-containing protein